MNAVCILLLNPRKVESEYAFVNGTVTIAGLFNIQTRKGTYCEEINEESVMTLEAIRWYINQLNDNRALPFKIGELTHIGSHSNKKVKRTTTS